MDDQRNMRRKGRLVLFLGLPVAALVGGLGLLLLILAPRFTVLSTHTQQPAPIPVTGPEDTPAAPQSPAPSLPPEKAPTQPGGSSAGYLDAAQNQMEQCYVSFQTFFTFEQMILDQPAMITDNRWRYRSSAAVDDFGATCGALADLPDAPRVYQELKHWLDLSASEAAAAQTSFTAALNAGVDGAFPMQEISDTTTHLMNFIEYTHKAENVLQGARDMINL